MYRELAQYYDLVYSFKDYRAEAAALHAQVRKYGRSGGKDLLDVGCGTGRHLEHLRRWYRCAGLDLSPEMLKVARQRLPGVKFHRGSMEKFQLQERFDVVVCLFGALGYTRTLPRMERAVERMAAHLKPGGVLLIVPWVTPENWAPPAVRGLVGQENGVSVARVSWCSRPRPRISRIEFQYLIGRRQGITHVTDIQELGLFTNEEVQRAIRGAGLRSRRLRKFAGSTHGLHIGVAPGA